MSRFEAMWDRFWTDLPTTSGASPWDVDPTYVAHAHVHLFGSVLDPSKPVIDVGCGDGAQTAALATHFGRVVGVDVAPERRRARAQTPRRSRRRVRTAGSARTRTGRRPARQDR
ncbi:methyltransferase domain-containing protein [Streptomyces sp. NPDC006649]|uniref:class I SAM-dependent methyltransferase n=1 Tax=Streptomyces sp. NPDC006649 TaxID=3156896 RepID=UPI0033A11A87